MKSEVFKPDLGNKKTMVIICNWCHEEINPPPPFGISNPACDNAPKCRYERPSMRPPLKEAYPVVWVDLPEELDKNKQE